MTSIPAEVRPDHVAGPGDHAQDPGPLRGSRGQWGRAMRTLLALVRNHPVRYLVGLGLWIVNWVWPMALGFIGQAYFDLLDGDAVTPGLAAILAALAAWLAVRLAAIFVGMWQYAGVVFRAGATLQRNMLAWMLAQPGAQGSRLSTGEVVSRFRDDVEHTSDGFDGTVDVIGAVVVGILSFVVLARIDPVITSLMFVPLLATVAIVAGLGGRIAAYRTAAREATEDVTGFLGETFHAVQSIKVAGAEGSMLTEFGRRNDRRRGLMVRDRTLESVTDALGMNMVNVATGVVLVMAAGSLARPGGLDVGQFALFTYLIAHVGAAAWHVGVHMAQLRQTGVSVDRMLDLMPGARLADLTRRQPLEEDASPPRATAAPPGPAPASAPATVSRRSPATVSRRSSATAPRRSSAPGHAPAGTPPLVSVRGLTHVFPGARPADVVGAGGGNGSAPEDPVATPSHVPGIRDVDLDLHRGQFVVVTGRVGAGKTTLLRTVMGLLPAQAGTVSWQGTPLADPAATMVPPRAAYTPQVPRLFSMSLRANLVMGADAGDEQVHAALAAAAMARDVAAMPHGLDTLVGSRGMRLSGGQVQRAATARMLVHDPELLVIDDVSSALDVETEAALWDRLGSRGTTTALVVSHRRPALRRADLVLVVEEGRIVARGTADELLERSATFRTLWG